MALGSAAMGVLGRRGTQAAEQMPSEGTRLKITMAGYRLDRVDALIDGRVTPEGCEAKFEVARIGDMNTHVFSGPGTREVTEIGLNPYLLAHANEAFRDYTLIPVFPLRLFRHKSIFIRTDRGITGPEDLRGKTVATAGYSSTSLTWIRGFMQHEYGVQPTDLNWVIASKESSADASGGASKQEQVLPDGIKFMDGPPGKDESEMLADGSVDAVFHAAEPRAYVEGHPKVARLFPDYRAVERAYFLKTGIFPIMHAVAMRRDVVEAHPWLVASVFKAYSRAKQLAYDRLNGMAWVEDTLPWIGQEVEETRALMGENYWPYGIEPNWKALDSLFQYAHEQGLARSRVQIEDVFHPSTWKLSE
jgi:4,5-dihydroxyphthalate decarboxylase